MTRPLRFASLVLVVAASLCAQSRVDPRYTYHRVIAVVPLVGSGTAEDPIRAKYAPASHEAKAPGSGIIAFAAERSDDGKLAIVELVAVERATLGPILADSSILVFEKGVAQAATIEAAIKPHRKDFSLQNFGVVVQ